MRAGERRGWWVVVAGLMACDAFQAAPYTPGVCIADEECPASHYCHTSEAEEGVCEPGTRAPGGEPVATLLWWNLIQDGKIQLASTGDSVRDGEVAPGAYGWLHSGGFEIEAQVAGPGGGRGLRAWWGGEGGWEENGGKCSVRGGAGQVGQYNWHCIFMGGQWPDSTGMELRVYVQAGPGPQGGEREVPWGRGYFFLWY